MTPLACTKRPRVPAVHWAMLAALPLHALLVASHRSLHRGGEGLVAETTGCARVKPKVN